MTLVKINRRSAASISAKFGVVFALAISTATPLYAQDTIVQGKVKRSDVVEQRVRYSDLDLTNEQNQLVLVSRVKRAANKVCDIIYRGQHPLMKFESGCTHNTFQDAKPQIDLAIASAQSGTRVAIVLSPRSR